MNEDNVVYRVWVKIEDVDQWLKTYYLADDEIAAARLMELIKADPWAEYVDAAIRPETK